VFGMPLSMVHYLLPCVLNPPFNGWKEIWYLHIVVGDHIIEGVLQHLSLDDGFNSTPLEWFTTFVLIIA
jgi:hypothetical protein